MSTINNEINPAFICPIGQEIMTDPVIYGDGFTYERTNIQLCIDAGHNKSPLTREIVTSRTLIPNITLRILIKESQNPTLAQPVQQVMPSQNQPPPIDMTINRIGENKYHISLKADDKSDATMPTLFIDVIDISGSMSYAAIPENQMEEEGGNFSREDLVKHSVATQIELLRSDDELAIVLFDHQATTVLQPTKMTPTGKTFAKQSLPKIVPTGGTNIWSGLVQALQIAKKNVGKNIVIILQTDGESQEQYSPPMGISGAFREWKEENAEVKFSLHTIGLSYGASLDMPLLLELAYAGNGTVNYIPDGSMVGTVFIHLMSNLMSCLYRGVYLRMTGNTTPTFFNVGFIQGGQSRDFVLDVPSSDTSENLFTVSLVTDNITDSQMKTVKKDMPIVSAGFIGVRDVFLKTLQKALYEKEMGKNVSTDLNTLYEFLQANVTDSKSTALLVDFKNPNKHKGQISKAFEDEHFSKWGRHYIPSVISAQRNQWGNNFKDEISKLYGGATVKNFIKQGNKLFMELPSPVPSIPGKKKQVVQTTAPLPTYTAPNILFQGAATQSTMSNFNNASSGCFLGDSMVRMVDGRYMKIDCLEQDDIVWGGYTVKCLVKFVVTSCQVVTLGKTGKCKITPWHPIKMNDKWVYPADVGKTETIETKCYYNFVLNSGHILDVDGVEACTLGHNFTGPVIEHSYFGKKEKGVHNIMEDLMGSSGWWQGHIIWRDVQYIRDPLTNLVIGVIKK